MPYYHVRGEIDGVTSAYKTSALGICTVSPTRRGKVFEINLGTLANPNSTDTYIDWDLSRISTSGTTTAWTPTAQDPADGAAQFISGINATVEPTVTANSTLKRWGMNQRNT